MSVINRMLADLERRGAPGADQAPASAESTPRERPRPWPALRRALPLLLLLALVAVAAALWRQRAPELLALVAEIGRAPSIPTAEPPPGAANASVARLIGLEFARDGERVRLVATLSGTPSGASGYSRNEDRIELRLPTPAERLTVPAPPAAQSVFRGLALSGADRNSTLLLTVDPRARFDLAQRGDRLVLSGRLPAEPPDAGPETGEAASALRERPTPADSSSVGPTPQPESIPESQLARAGEAGAPPGSVGDRPAEDSPGPTVQHSAVEAFETQEERRDQEPVATPVGADAIPVAAAAPRDIGGHTDDPARVRKSAPAISPAERASRLEREARTALETGNAGRARERLQRALAVDPDRHSARDLLVALVLRAGAADAARNLLAEGLTRAPERPGFARPYARLLVDTGALEEARQVLQRAAPGARTDAGYHGLMAAVEQRLGRHEQAVTAYTRALELDSGRGLWWLGLGISLAATERPEQARAALREARASGDLNERLDGWAQARIEALKNDGS